MAEQPWFKLYAADYLLDRDVDAMPREAEALLLRMWCICHLDGSCPADPETLARKTLCSLQYVLQCKPHCEPFFDLQDGKLYSRRMQEEKQRSEIARKNANERWKSKAKAKSEPEPESKSERGNADCIATRNAKHLPPADWIPGEAWAGFVEMRKKIRKPLTDHAVGLLVNRLDKLRTDGYDPAAVLDQSTRNDWQDIYPLRGANINGNGNRAQERQNETVNAVEQAKLMLDRRAARAASGTDG